LTQWAKYLEQYGLDPENQLCTDDFMGHLAHNANLSVKAILGLAAYGDMCQRRGDAANAARYAQLAKTDAAHWMQAAAMAIIPGWPSTSPEPGVKNTISSGTASWA
jgi:hypothetical protein